MDETFPPLITNRLILRRMGDGDLQTLLAYRSDPEVARYQSWSSFSEADARALIDEVRSLRPGTPGKWLQVAVELRETGDLIGDVAFGVDRWDPRKAEVGFTFARAWQGQGFATESVACLLSYLFGTLGLAQVGAITDSENRKAGALLRRLGFHFDENREVWFKGRWGGEDRYSLLREEWQRRISGVNLDDRPESA